MRILPKVLLEIYTLEVLGENYTMEVLLEIYTLEVLGEDYTIEVLLEIYTLEVLSEDYTKGLVRDLYPDRDLVRDLLPEGLERKFEILGKNYKSSGENFHHHKVLH